MANIEEKVEKLVSNPIKELGYDLYDIQYVKEGKDYFLRIFIDSKENPISLEDCEKVNNEINPLLDKADYISEQYFLEVSSAGVERVIRKEKHLQENIGELVTVRLFKPVGEYKEIIGILKQFDEEKIYINIEDNTIELERKNISLMKKYYNWD